MTNLFDAKTRAWIYGVVGTVVPLLVTLGIFSGEVAGHVMAIAAALLATGASYMAMTNTPKEPTLDDYLGE